MSEEVDFWYIYRNKLRYNIEQIKLFHFEIYKCKWAFDILLKPKLQTYIQTKDCYGSETYVQWNLSKHQKSICVQFRSGTLPLETGWFC